MHRLLIVVALTLLPMLTLAAAPAPLTATQIPALLKPPAHGERIIALWALDCIYCEPNLKALAALQRAHPHDIQLITVATDSITRRRAIEARLRRLHIADLPARAYAEATPERLNYLIDPNWGGEMPRTLVIRADGARAGVSGKLTQEQLRQLWPLPRNEGSAEKGPGM